MHRARIVFSGWSQFIGKRCRVKINRWLMACTLAAAVFAALPLRAEEKAAPLKLDPSQAEIVLEIVEKKLAGREIDAADWERLLACNPYRRLIEREKAMAALFNAPERALTDEKFRAFILEGSLEKHAAALRRTLQEWRRAKLQDIAETVQSFLPAGTRIQAAVYPVIKPAGNSFVWEAETNPAIFLYLDPAVGRMQFANTVAHELHHIGLASIEERQQKRVAGKSEAYRAAFRWLGAFGEGLAMLAAAGGADEHPHKHSPAADRARWDRDMARCNDDMKKVEEFFLSVLNGRLSGEEKVNEAGYAFFGIQGPWYTIGYRMAALVEVRAGRQALLQCMEDPRQLLAEYNRLAQAENEKGAGLALWSGALLGAIGDGR